MSIKKIKLVVKSSKNTIDVPGLEFESHLIPSEILNEYDNPDDDYHISDPSEFQNDSAFICGYEERESHTFVKHERSILPSLANYSIPDNIKKEADVIYNKMKHQVRRAKKYTMLLYYCVKCAYLEEINRQNMKITTDSSTELLGYISSVPINLHTQFGLTKSDVQKCDNIFAPLQTGYKPPYSYNPPTTYLPVYCRHLGISQDYITEIITLAKSILMKEPKLYQDYPQTIAAGILHYFITIYGIMVDNMDIIVKLTGKPITTIERISKEITIIDNRYV